MKYRVVLSVPVVHKSGKVEVVFHKVCEGPETRCEVVYDFFARLGYAVALQCMVWETMDACENTVGLDCSNLEAGLR